MFYLSGDEKVYLINKNSDASYGELHFIDNAGIEHVLIRGKHRYDNSKNFITLDGKVVTQKDLISIYKDKKLFLSILNPLYFLSKKPAEQKELVDKYLSDICPNNLMEIVYNKLSKDEQEILSKETEFNELETSMKVGKKNYLEIKTGVSSFCPTCGQYIQDESKKRTITNMHDDLVSKYDKKNLLETQVKDLKLKLATEKCNYHSLEGNLTIEKSKRIAVIEDNIKQLKNEKLEIEKFRCKYKILFCFKNYWRNKRRFYNYL